MNREKVHTEERDGFTLTLYLCEEDITPADSFDSSIDDIDEINRKIESGEYLWFCAQVTASKAGIELASDYLGGCLYGSVAEFIAPGGYYEDMCGQAISAARAKLAELCA